MTNKSRFFLSIFILVGFCVFGYLSNSVSKETFSSITTELTLRQAVDLAKEEVYKWNPNAQLSNIVSVDNPEEKNKTDGIDGKRRYWNLQFVAQIEKKSMGLTIHDGQIVNKWYGEDDSGRGFDIPSIFDSSDALKKTIALYNIKPGKGWAGGYHFQLAKQKEKLVMTVFGRDSKNNFSRVDFDILTGEITSALHKVPYGGGFYSGNSNAPLFNDEQTTLIGSVMSPNFVSDKSLFLWGIRNESNSPFIEMSKDGGLSWININIQNLNNIVNVQFSDNYKQDRTVFITTNDRILKSTNLGNIWEIIYVSKQEIISSFWDSNKFAILTNNNNVLVSSDEENWVSFDTPEGGSNILINSNGSLILKTIDSIYARNADVWTNIKVPFKNPYGEPKHISDKLMINSYNTIGLQDDFTGEWNITRTLYQIENVWLVQNSEFSQDPTIYAYSKDGRLFRIQKGGGSFQVKLSNKGTIAQIINASNNLFFLMNPILEWENWVKG